MKIEHIALWVRDLEKTKAFYMKYFHASCNDRYTNEMKGFSSYFLTFSGATRLEIMTMHQVDDRAEPFQLGWAHMAISVGSKEDVDQLTERLRVDGYTIFGEPRITGDGYYESVVLDPEGNHLEITL
ncbi:VOC family protein [Rossellomorea marisflavi]|uniref:VOC family protein n=1 Tax=Rossellomorea marisflavi TaxID=189381 RepID=UPI00296FF17E|nr:VOC family protein [Rossellomorea marisflavi]MDW4525408.1 VOC family protein [Rossellomorea marisflavi]